MARLARLYVPGVTQLVVISLSPSFSRHNTLGFALITQLQRWLVQGALRYRIAVHGWAFDSVRIALLLTPGDAKGLGQLVQMLGRHLAASLGQGEVFSNRYKSALLQTGKWVLPALIWLEGQPTSFGQTGEPESWPWSSARAHCGIQASLWLSPHADYWACGNTPFDRQANYRALLQRGNAAAENQAIEAAVRGQWALGEDAFLNDLAKLSNRRVSPCPRGRPKKLVT
jgi:putative transposase